MRKYKKKKKKAISGSTFGAVLAPLFLLPFGRPLGRFGVGGPTGSWKERERDEVWSHSVFQEDQHPPPYKHGLF